MNLTQATTALEKARNTVAQTDRDIRQLERDGDYEGAVKLHRTRPDLVKQADKAFVDYEEASAEETKRQASPEFVKSEDQGTKTVFASFAKAADSLQDALEAVVGYSAAFTEASEAVHAEFGTNVRLRQDVRVTLDPGRLILSEMGRLRLPGGVADLVNAGVDHVSKLPSLGNIVRALLKNAWKT